MKTTKEKNSKIHYRQDNPTIFPFGLGVRRVAKEAVVIDFIDGSEPPKIISSVAILRDQAINLAESILEALNDEDDQE